MFYSHTFLARKGPLGTVWCAAHLQHKLKKSHYISTNVYETAERIMYPEVPIALRMSGHLLLGVVRIYSKQVDYLYEDCNEIRITINRVFTNVNVNLPNDATHAPLHSITLPEKFNLDTMELDDYYTDWGEDSHLKSKDDITLTEQFPTGKDPYIVITFNEHDLRKSPPVEDNSGSVPTPMEEDVPPPVGLETADADFEYPSPGGQEGSDDRNGDNSSPKDLRSAEKARDAEHGFDFNNSTLLPERADPDTFLAEQFTKEKETKTPVIEEAVFHDGLGSSSHHHEGQLSFGHLDPPNPFADQTPPDFQIQQSPPAVVHQSSEMENQPIPPVAQPRVRRNRKRQLYDESTVLSNRHMKDALHNTSNIRRSKRNCPLSSLAIWKQNNRVRLRKEGLFVEPFITGTSADLQGTYKEDLSRHESDDGVEHLRNNEYARHDMFMPEPSEAVPSPNERSCCTPQNSNLGLQSEHREMTEGTDILPTADTGASGNLDSEIRTPDAFYDKDMQVEDDLFDIPELVASPGELRFLDQDDASPARSQGTPKFSVSSKNKQIREMSSRTRAVAQYLERQSVNPIAGKSGGPPAELSLNKIVEGKTRKICARMFYETLVLKSLGLVDAHQEHPYGDTILKVTPTLSKGKFTS